MSPAFSHGIPRTLVPVVTPEAAEAILPVAAALVPPEGELVVLSVTEVPSTEDMSAAARTSSPSSARP